MADNQAEINGRPLNAEIYRPQKPRYFNQQERHDRIDKESDRIGNPRGPQAAKEPEAIPGYRQGFDIRINFANADQPQAVLLPGVVAIHGQLVRTTENQNLDTSSVEWTNGAIPAQRFYVYINQSGDISVDVRKPVANAEMFTFVHPVYQSGPRARVALGQLFLDLNKLVVFGIPGLSDPNTIVVAANGYIGQASYYCGAINNQVEINAAALYLRLSRRGGVIQLTSGQYYMASSIILGGNSVSIQGEGHSTSVFGRPAPPPEEGVDPELAFWANEDVGVRTTSVISLRAAPLQPGEEGVDREDGTAANQVRSMRVWFDGDNSPIFHTAWGGDVSQGGAGAQLRTDVGIRAPEIEIGEINEEIDRSFTPGSERMYSDGRHLAMRRADGTEWKDTITLDAADAANNPSIVVRDIFGNDRIIIEARGSGPFIRIIGSQGTSELYGDRMTGPGGASWNYRGDLEVARNITSERGDIEAEEGDIKAGGKLEVTGKATFNSTSGDDGIFVRGSAQIVRQIETLFNDIISGRDVSSTRDLLAGRDAVVTGQIRWPGGFQWTRNPRDAYRRLNEMMDVGEEIGVNGLAYDTSGITNFMYTAYKESSSRIRLRGVQFNHRVVGSWEAHRGDNDVILRTTYEASGAFFLSWYEIRGTRR